MSVDSRLLIKQIEARPALWDRHDKDYCHHRVISKLWAEIALVHGVHESRVKSKWKALRDTFRQELKKNPEHSLWGYYLDMQFLKGQLRTLPVPSGTPSVDEDSGDATFVKTEPEDTCRDEDQVRGRAERLLPEPDSSRNCTMPEDDDFHFLMSLLPEMRKLEPRQKLNMRIKMMELVYKEAYQQEF